ncbi:hypothetical protein Clacol_003710 [Clathrus columnatus]|uniref:RBR-type E3 ubiquitin transferase n=1 Tax=Clathrus columnatus TaxID=1419009 RepID=A0AAV5A749_9AGAM|nr:hypothetical protein Clacol_003710 [Clathrus columnatus]
MNSDFEDLEYKDEWEALQVTYPELDLAKEPPLKGASFQLRIQIDFSKTYTLNITDSHGSTSDHHQSNSEGLIQISHLPPINITLLLPSLYPREESPQILSLWSTHDWLPNNSVQKLIRGLQNIWDRQRSIVLALWIDHIRDGEELLEFLGFLNKESAEICILSRSQADDLRSSLQTYNDMVSLTSFNNNRYRCPVCFDRLQGTECISLSPCHHVACKKCLADGWSLYIAEGRSELVGCPDPQCVKAGKLALLQDVQVVLSQQQVVRWQWLVRKKEVEKDPSIVFCPQISCQRPVKKEPTLDGRSFEWERLRQCECGFSFCVYCRRTWHGPHLPCPFPSSADFVKKYVELPLGSPEKLALEKRYGKSNLVKLVAKYREDQLNRAWLESQTMAIPSDVPGVKSE